MSDPACNEQRNGNGKWESRWVWATRILIALLTWLALTIWNDLRAVGEDVAQLTTGMAVQKQRIDDHDRRIGSVEVRVYSGRGD